MSQAAVPHAYEIKSASLPLVSFLLKNPDTSVLQADMARRLGATPDFFDNDPVVIDLSVLEDPHHALDLPSVCLMLRTYRMLPVAVRGANEYQLAQANQAGLFEARDLSIQAPAATRVETVAVVDVRHAAWAQRFAKVVLPCYSSSSDHAFSAMAAASMLHLLVQNVAVRLGKRAQQRQQVVDDINQELGSD